MNRKSPGISGGDGNVDVLTPVADVNSDGKSPSIHHTCACAPLPAHIVVQRGLRRAGGSLSASVIQKPGVLSLRVARRLDVARMYLIRLGEQYVLYHRTLNYGA